MARTHAITALVSALATALLTGAPSYAGRDATTSGLTVTGRGYGTGEGLSIEGADVAASRGLSEQRILAFYLPGLTRSTAGGTIAVLISDHTGSDTIVKSRPGLRAGPVGGRMRPATHPGAAFWKISPTDDGARSTISYRLRGEHGQSWHLVRTVDGPAQFGASGAPVVLHYHYGPDLTWHFAYRGELRSVPPTPGSSTRVTVDVVGLDPYAADMVSADLAGKATPAGVRAALVAARTEAVYQRRHPLSAAYDTCASTVCQGLPADVVPAYQGTFWEGDLRTADVAATRHQVLTFRGRPARTPYLGTDGGWTAAGGTSYLPARRDPYEPAGQDWSASLTSSAIEQAYPAIGTFTSASVLTRDGHGQWGGRVLTLRLTGTGGSVTTTGTAFAAALDLHSSWFTLG